jgi:hypothetical protein
MFHFKKICVKIICNYLLNHPHQECFKFSQDTSSSLWINVSIFNVF